MSKPTPDDLPESYLVCCDACGEHDLLYGEGLGESFCYGCMQSEMDEYPDLFEDAFAEGDASYEDEDEEEEDDFE